MKAGQARFISEQQNHRSFEAHLNEAMAETEDPVSFLREVIWTIVLESIQFKSQQGRTKSVLEPFSLIPGKLHSPECEDQIMEQVAERLTAEDYQNVQWDRRDKRIILQFEW